MSTPDRPPPLSALSVRHNTLTLQYARSSLAAIAGAAAGILGLQGLTGFFFYLLTSGIMSALLYAYSARFTPKTYFANSASVWTAEVGGNLFSYVLFWTLAYG
ncbi:ER membrane complex subunit 6, partial [Rhizophlyctis rosea]